MKWSKNRLAVSVYLVVLIHIVLLFAVIPIVSAHLGSSYNPERYADGYDYIAASLAAGDGYRFYPDTARTLMREPGYPLVLTAIFATFGNVFVVVEMLNVILALTTAWMISLIVRKISNNHWAGLATAILFLFHPGVLVAESRGGVEILFGFLIVLFILTLLKALEVHRLRDYALCGVVLGITALVRSVPILFPVFLLAYLIVFERRRVSVPGACKRIAIMVAMMVVVLSPWIIRNYLLTKRFVPTASVLGVSAQAGQYIGTHLSEGKPWWLLDREAAQERDRLAMQLGLPFRDTYYQTFYKTQDEMRFSNFLLGRVIQGYEKSPTSFGEFVIRNCFNFWFTGKTRGATLANVLCQAPYLFLALIGIVIGIRTKQTRVVAPIVVFSGYVMAVYLPILAQARYSIPLVPFLCILATITLLATWKKLSKGEREVEILATVDVNDECAIGDRQVRIDGKMI
jgi:hypothetical protein